MTRAEIRAKHGIVRLEHPDIANKQLSDKEAENYERLVISLADNFDELWNCDDSGEIE